MNKKQNEDKFHFVYKTEEDVKRENQEKSKSVNEDSKSDFVFNGEFFYYIGRGHSFGFGFHEEYITKSAIVGYRYASGNWIINSNSYEHIDNEFVLIQKKPRQENPLNESSLNFPMVKQVSTVLLSGQLISVQPKKQNKGI
jgi:hypothetical protein